MPTIISSTTLRNDYAGVSERCHSTGDPVFVTKNGAGDLAVMSIDAYEALAARADLYGELARGHRDVVAGDFRDARDAMASIRSELAVE